MCSPTFLSNSHRQYLNNQLFGQIKGAYTGAMENRDGLLLQADGGTLFLDRVEEMPLETQVKFLRFLQEGEIIPLGSTETKKIQVRIIASTSLNLQKQVSQGKFREDLFYRLNVVTLSIPPLRERKEDIPLLIRYFLDKENQNRKGPRKEITDRALKALCYHRWPGNVRQLQNTLQSLISLTPKHRIDLKDLPQNLQKETKEIIPLNLDEAKEMFTRKYFTSLMEYSGGNMTKAAKISGIPRPSLHRQIKEHLGD